MSMRRPAPGGGDARGRVRLHRPLPPGPHRDGIVASERADPLITGRMIMELLELTHGHPGTEGGAPAIIQRVRDSSRLGHLHDHALSSISREPGGQVRTPLLTHHRRALSPFSHACTIA